MAGIDLPRRGIVVEELRLRTLPMAISHAVRGHDVRYLNSQVGNGASSRLLKRLSITPISLESEESIPLGQHSYDGPLFAARSLVENMGLKDVIDFLGSRYPTVAHAGDAFGVALVQAMTTDVLGTFVVDTWIRARDYEHAEVRSRTPEETAILRHLGPPATVQTANQLKIPWDRIARVVSKSLAGFATRLGSHSDATLASQSQARTPAASDPAEALVLMIFNHGDTYGQLYAYDHLFSTDPSSPLFRERTALISQSGGPLSGGGVAAPFPLGGSWLTRHRAARSIYRTLQPLAGPSVPDQALWILALLVARIDATVAQLRTTYPVAQVACLVYEIQVPAYLSLALDVAGIQTVALHERPETAFEHVSPIIANTVLAGSPFLAKALRTSWSTAISVVEPIGMWRTDLLMDADKPSWPCESDPSAARGRRLILALPFHVAHDGPRPGNPIATAFQTMEHFLQDMMRIADGYQDCFVVIRAKNADWVNDIRLAEVIAAVRSRENMAISTDYSRLAESYRLCANADLVIGKATSLIDECLAVGIPAVLHDYTQNSSGSRKLVLNYLPREIWALDEAELASRVSFGMADDGNTFRDWWEPHRSRIYGDLNNGIVRERAREHILEIVGRKTRLGQR